MREIEVARTMLRQTQPMQVLKNQQPDRYLRLEHMLARTYFDVRDAYLYTLH